jgi:4-hydroxy-3-methylbut-2-enyl diphosphate reductase
VLYNENMKVIKSAFLGFCMGVRRAVSMAEAESVRLADCKGQVYTLGPLVHNPKVSASLEARGIKTLKEPPLALNGGSVIIRAHGIRPQTEADLLQKGAKIVDATCPKVKTSQLKAEELARAGYRLFLAGEAEHAEIEGITGYAGEANCAVVSNAAEAASKAKKLRETVTDAKIALIGQTTISEEEYNAIGKAIKEYFPNLEVIQTICSATKDRQHALRDLLGQVEAVLIAGGKDSANTRRLLAIAQESGKPCALVENAAEIPQEFYGYSIVGLSAGASTPDEVIEEIEAAFKN